MGNELAKAKKVELVKLPENRLTISPKYSEVIKSDEIIIALKTTEVDLLIEDGNNLLTRGCVNEDDAAEYALNIANSGKLATSLDKARLELTKSIRDDLSNIKDLFDENIRLLNTVKNKLNNDYVRYEKARQEAERKRIEEEQRKAAEEEKKRQEEEQRKAEEAAALEVEETLFDDELPEPAPIPEPVPVQAPSPVTVAPMKMKTASGTIKVVDKCTAIVVDKDKVPEEFKDVNTVRIEKAWNDGRKTIPGIRFEVESTTSRK
jgi:hypothetical protein